MALPKPEPEKPEEPKEEEKPAEAEEPEVVEEEEEEEEDEDVYNSDGELIEKPKKEKKEKTPPPKEPTPPPKEPTPPPKEPTPPPKEPTPPPKEPVKKRRRSWLERFDGIIAPPQEEEEKPKEPEEPKEENLTGEIEKPITIYRPHRIREFRKNAQVPLEIVKRLLSQMVKIGSPLKLSCCVSEGDSRIKVDWTRDGEPVEMITGSVVANATEDGRVTLEFKKVGLSDAGRYKCVVKTKKGHISSECDIKVYGDPEEPVEDVPPTLVSTIAGECGKIYFELVLGDE